MDIKEMKQNFKKDIPEKMVFHLEQTINHETEKLEHFKLEMPDNPTHTAIMLATAAKKEPKLKEILIKAVEGIKFLDYLFK